jgi:hypothetical protein
MSNPIQKYNSPIGRNLKLNTGIDNSGIASNRIATMMDIARMVLENKCSILAEVFTFPEIVFQYAK